MVEVRKKLTQHVSASISTNAPGKPSKEMEKHGVSQEDVMIELSQENKLSSDYGEDTDEIDRYTKAKLFIFQSIGDGLVDEMDN
jgi:hypothetical protein